jgi:OOP family OmpA-OmpF porin
MRLIMTILLVAVLVPALVAELAVAECGKDCKGDKCRGGCKCKKTDPQITNFIYDVTIPWPFRKHAGDADGDGVADKIDKCANTPKGAKVDAVGCPMDADGDGVYDGLDQCPETPKGAKVDEKGCPTDSDDDGVSDGLDQCPGTPKGTAVDKTGCPMDADGDGVADGIDRCPNTPKGAKVDEKGCPMDSDGDGVYDGIDRCPNTPKGVKVDAHGCTEMETKFLDTGVFRTSEIRFDTGKAAIKPESYAVIDQVGRTLAQWPELKIEIGGHTDAVGTDANNQTLSDKRAQAVLDYLVNKHPDIKQGQFTTRGYGESNPIATNDTPEGRTQNRRVEFTILNKEVLQKETPQKR